MNTLRYLRLVVWAVALLAVTACKTSRSLEGKPGGPADNKPAVTAGNEARTDLSKEQFLRQVVGNAQESRFITSKVKFSVETGNRHMTLTGNLRMKRDDVIRLQLMAFGFVEAARLEFTKDYVLIVDRINKQFLQVPYTHLEFLRNSGIDFNVLQALFWNELFQPGQKRPAGEDMGDFTATPGNDNNVVVSLSRGKMNYRWLVEEQSARVVMANVMYNDRIRGNYLLNWDYEEFKRNDRKMFPTHHKIEFTTPKKSVKLDMILNYVGAEEGWETRTELSGRYRQVPVEEILNRFMSL